MGPSSTFHLLTNLRSSATGSSSWSSLVRQRAKISRHWMKFRCFQGFYLLCRTYISALFFRHIFHAPCPPLQKISHFGTSVYMSKCVSCHLEDVQTSRDVSRRPRDVPRCPKTSQRRLETAGDVQPFFLL